MTLAYVFWHWPRTREPGDSRVTGGPAKPVRGAKPPYLERMQAFHDALARPGTATFALERAPWAAGDDPAPFEDWYPVADWAALGELNDLVVTGARRAPHDAVAALSRAGSGAVYKRLAEGPPLAQVRFAAWLDARPDAAGDAWVWQRQLVLGPAPEYAVLAASPVPVPAGAVLTGPRPVAGA